MIRTLVIDDEPPARRRLRDLLRDCPDVDVVGEGGTVAEARDLVQATQPDLIFLDVRMPGGDGFSLGTVAPEVIFVSAFSEHALRAFEFEALDYLMKPFTRDRLAQSLDRYRQRRPVQPVTPLRRLPVDVGRTIRFVDVDSIDCARAEGNYVRVHSGQQSYLLRDTLANLCARVGLLRVHRSCAVRPDQVREVETLAHGEFVLRLGSGASVITGRSYRDAIRAALGLSVH